MSPERSWARGFAALTAWCLMTAIATTASWWGLSAVLTSDHRSYEESAMVVATPEPSDSPSSDAPSSPSPSSEEPRTAEEDTPDEPSSEEPPEHWIQVGEQTYERTFDTSGGVAVIQVSPAEATLVSASPADGYQAERTQAGANRYVVTFYGMDGAIVIDAGWKDGEPYSEVSGE